jgi:NTP pyrophosphatase (non-canonical NTP hydrolase)
MIGMNNMVVRRIGVDMEKRLEEILHITQEECAEVSQAISKVFRFGFAGSHGGKSNKQSLEEEIGDLECMLELLKLEFAIDREQVELAKLRKAIKLNTWSTHIRTEVV